MSIASTNKDIIRVKEQIRQLSAGIPTFDGSLYSQVGHTHSIPQIAELSTTLAGKQNTLIAGTNINIDGNTINATGASQWTTLGNTIYYNLGNVGIGTSTLPAKLTISGASTHPRIVLSGEEFYGVGNTSIEGVAFLTGVNRTDNRQLWIGDSAKLTKNTTNGVLRLTIPSTAGTASIDCIATDGTTKLKLNLHNSITILADGKVGVGTSNPSAELDVVGLVKSTVGFQHGDTVLKNITYTTADIVLVNNYYYMFNSTYFMNNGLRGSVLYSAISLTNHRNNGIIFIDSAYNIIEHIRWMYNNGIDVNIISGDLELRNATGSQNTFQMTFTLLG